MQYKLECTKCKHIELGGAFRCKRCGAILEVVYTHPIKQVDQTFKNSKPKFLKYINFLPIPSVSVSFGEGGTPLKQLNLKETNDCNLFLKLETSNPTKTFKDRGSAVEISKAIELDYAQVCCASTGNMGLSVAHYAKKAGLKCTIFISKSANPKKIKKIEEQKAKLVKVDGDFNKALRTAELYARKKGAFVCGDYHFRKEGQKTVGYEIIEQLHYKVPDFIFLPVGNATLFSGIYKGLKEFKRANLIKKLPKLVAVQSKRCDPLVRAYQSNKKMAYVKPNTEADAIAVGYPTFGFEAINAIKSTKGQAISVTEEEIEKAVRLLEKSGIYSELGGGTGFAGFIKEYNESSKLNGKDVVVVVTGNNEGVFK